MGSLTIYFTYVDSPVGKFLVAGTQQRIHFTGFTTGHQQRPPKPEWLNDRAPIAFAADQIDALFGGDANALNIPTHTQGTAFQEQVWRELQLVGFGKTASYGEIAKRIGRPAASRAVGAANRANHLPIIIPCHRIIGTNGSLTGFGGGLSTKMRLLNFESEHSVAPGRQYDLWSDYSDRYSAIAALM